MDLTFQPLFSAVCKILEGGRVPMITSAPGVGKSALARLIADFYNLEYIDIRLTTYNPVSLNGYPDIDRANNRSSFVPMSVIPLEGRDKVPKGKDGWLINFDELPDCTPTMQSAAYKIILDRYVGEHKIHTNVLMMACGNGVKHGAAAHRITSAMKSRMVHLGMASCPVGWVDWGTKAKLDYRILSFIQERPDLLNNFKPSDVNEVINFACERTYHALSDIIKDEPEYTPDLLPIMHGAIGEGAATELYSYVTIFSHLPSIDSIVNDPYAVMVPQEPSSRYALIHKIVAYADKKNFDNLFKFVKRMDSEYVMMCARNVLRKDKSFKTHPEVRKMIAQFAVEFDFIQ